MSVESPTWNMHYDMHGSSSFPLSRFLESTQTEITNRLYPITEDSLSFVENLPVLFMTEMESEQCGEGIKNFVKVRVGKIFNLKIEYRDITFSFEIKNDFGKIYVESVNTYENILGTGSFGLHRTHWSVKNKGLSDVLNELGLEELQPDLEIIPPPPVQTKNKICVDSVESFLSIVFSTQEDDNNDDLSEVFYRGHSNYNYKLEPSLFRKNSDGIYRYLSNEDKMTRELLTVQATEFLSDKYMLDKLVRMQHYGLPTRLLDVTSNPLVALYFACSEEHKDTNGGNVDGQVIILKTGKENIKFFDSDTVSCISNLSLLSTAMKESLNTEMLLNEFNKSHSCTQLVHLIKDEKSYFENKISPNDIEKILLVRGRILNDRISSQSGSFLIFGHNSILPETGLSSIDIQKINIKNKTEILKQLNKLNINESTVYPGIEKAAKEIAKKYDGKY
jgi:hypothetical protein